MVKKEAYLFLGLMLLILIVPIASAGFLNNIWGKITGEVTSATNVSITVSGTQTVVINVLNGTMIGTDVDPTISGVTTIQFFVNVSDPDGNADINTSSVNASFIFHDTGFGQTTRTNSSYGCISKGSIDSKSLNFSCRVSMYFFDAPGTYTIEVYARDGGSNTNQKNITQLFSYDTLQAVAIQPNSISFPSAAPGAFNVTSSNDPTLLNNTGNANFTAIDINSTDLFGFVVSSESIPAINFSVGNSSLGATAEECGDAKTRTLYNDTILTAQQFKLLDGNFTFTRGNHSLNDNHTGQEQFFWCIRQIPEGISSQVYNTSAGNAWTIRVA